LLAAIAFYLLGDLGISGVELDDLGLERIDPTGRRSRWRH
jgi:hypothetical protein